MSSESGWREALAEYIGREARPVDKFGHQPRLYALTRAIGLKEPYDDDVVYAAAWLHDLGVFTGHRPEDLEALARWDNVAYALDQAPAVLERLQFPRDSKFLPCWKRCARTSPREIPPPSRALSCATPTSSSSSAP